MVAFAILYLSLASADTFARVPIYNIPHLDKIVHFAMYFGLMSAIIYDNKKSIKKTVSLFLIGLIPLSYGIIMEFLQRHDFDLVCRAHMVVEDGYEFFNDRILVTVFSAPNV